MTKIEQLKELIRPDYDNGDPDHDMAHILRVVETCEKLGREENASLDLLVPAALLHDVVNIPKDHPDRINASRLAAEKAKSYLSLVNYSQSEIDAITTIIEEHSYSLGKKPSNIESAILQDADRLDALGAIGIMRNISCGTKMSSQFYCNEEPFVKTRELDDKKFSIDHFYVKLFKLPALMNTKAAKKEADRRVEFMNSFVAQLKSEI